MDWQPIETYPRDHDPGPDTYWGDEVVFLCAPCEHYEWKPTIYVGHLEADMWFVRDCDEPTCWAELHCPPSHWMPLPTETPSTPAAASAAAPVGHPK